MPIEIKTNHLYLIKYEQRMKNVRTGEYLNIKELLTGYFNVGAEGDDKYFVGMSFGKTVNGFAYGIETYIEKCVYSNENCTILKDLGEII